jgi:hypothetical protein
VLCRYDLEANPVTQDHIRGAGSRWLSRYGRVLAIAAGWTGLAVIATSIFFWPRAQEAQPTANDVVAFALSVTLAATVAASAAFAVVGRWRWAADTALSVILVALVTTVLLAYVFWIDTRFARGQMGFWEFKNFQRMTQFWAIQIAGFVAPLGAAVGVVVGIFAGVLIRLVRRMPRLGPAIALSLLVAWAAAGARGFGAGLLTTLGWGVRYFVVPWSIASDEIAETAMLFGAILGAVVAGAVIYLASRAQHAAVMRGPSLAADGAGG